MNKIEFNKPALSIEEQIKLLKKRNLIIEDEDIPDLEKFLLYKNYYRISPYWKTMDCNHHIIKGNVSFKQIKKRYNTDHNLLLSILEALKVIEIAIKNQFAYTLSLKYQDPYFYLNSKYFKNSEAHQKQINLIKKELDRSQSSFVKHYLDKYVKDEPPVWATVEVLSFGTIVKLLSLLKNKDKELIAKEMGFDIRFFYSCVNVFYILRNLSADHSILFNQNLKLTLHKNNSEDYKEFESYLNLENNQKKKVFNWIILILFFLDRTKIESSFKGKILNILKKVDKEDYYFYGLPEEFLKTLDKL